MMLYLNMSCIVILGRCTFMSCVVTAQLLQCVLYIDYVDSAKMIYE